MTKATLLLAAFLTIISTPTVAQDISNEQRNAYEARQAYNKKMSAHKNLLTRVSQQEKRINDEQTRLDQLKADEQKAMSELGQAKTNLDSKVNALNAIWELRDK